MLVSKEISNYWELKDNSWSGALDTLKDIENTDKEDELMELLEETFADREEIPTETEVNDFLWFERYYIYENLGLNENGELPTIFDELDETYLLDEDDINTMEESELFHEEFIKECREDIEKSWNETDPHRHKGCIVRSKGYFNTEETAQWVIDNL